MHELSLAINIVEGVIEELHARGDGVVETVHLRVGRLSGVDKDALAFSYGIACQDTPIAESRLLIEDVDVTVFCPNCKAERPVLAFPVLACAECGTAAEKILRGKELEITALEMIA